MYVYMWEELENVLEIGDLDSRMRVDFLVTRRLSLDIAVELFEKDLIAQDFGATNRAMSIPWTRIHHITRDRDHNCRRNCRRNHNRRRQSRRVPFPMHVRVRVTSTRPHARAGLETTYVQAVDVHMRTRLASALSGLFYELVDVPGRLKN